MLLIDADGCPLWVESAGPERAPVLMLSNSLGTNLQMWDAQIAPFAKRFRVLRYDRRGHGKSGVTPGPYTMERLARDALAILDALGIARVHWCGLSMGGMEGMWLGAHAPGRIARLILSNTSAYYADKSLWDDRIEAIRTNGLAPLTDRVLGLWFTQAFRARAPQDVARLAAMLTATPVEGYIGCCKAIRDMDHRDLLPRIIAPTLVIAGRQDQATPLAAAELVKERVPGASLTILDAAHISNVEQPAQYADTVLRFLA
jgi:3-oxoadipate enol-lactonase